MNPVLIKFRVSRTVILEDEYSSDDLDNDNVVTAVRFKYKLGKLQETYPVNNHGFVLDASIFNFRRNGQDEDGDQWSDEYDGVWIKVIAPKYLVVMQELADRKCAHHAALARLEREHANKKALLEAEYNDARNNYFSVANQTYFDTGMQSQIVELQKKLFALKMTCVDEVEKLII